MSATITASSAVGELGPADSLARWCRRLDAAIAWKVQQEQRSDARFHQRRRQARRRRRQRVDRLRILLSTVVRRRQR